MWTNDKDEGNIVDKECSPAQWSPQKRSLFPIPHRNLTEGKNKEDT